MSRRRSDNLFSDDEFNNGEFESENDIDFDTVVNYILRRSIERHRTNRVLNIITNSMINNIYDFLNDYEYETVLDRSFNEQESLKRNEDYIDFKSMKYCKIESKNYEIQCSICLINYENEDDISLTKCNHLFHNNCIIEWSHYKKECPICRKDLKDC